MSLANYLCVHIDGQICTSKLHQAGAGCAQSRTKASKRAATQPHEKVMTPPQPQSLFVIYVTSLYSLYSALPFCFENSTLCSNAAYVLRHLPGHVGPLFRATPCLLATPSNLVSESQGGPSHDWSYPTTTQSLPHHLETV